MQLYWDDRQIRVFFTFLKVRALENKKGEMLLSPFLPQIYHKLNLLMLWFTKCSSASMKCKKYLLKY